jgi:ArsR family transcriptional regulator, virulence genes transcriptional regulator
MIPKEVYEMQAQLCQALGNATRLEIVHILRDGPQHVNSMAQSIGLSQASLSRQLKVLRDHNIVITQRYGKEIVYHLANPKIVDICNLLRQILTEQLPMKPRSPTR